MSIDSSLSWLLVEPHSPADLARSALRILDSTELRNELAERFRRRVIEAFSADQELAAYGRAYENILRG
jgi:glycosyltransferase involved in cell wall biosynthesis